MASENSVQRIVLEKTCTIEGATDLTSRVRGALAISNRLEFDLSDVAEMELPVIQVLYAAARSAIAAGGSVNLVGSIQESVSARLMVTGLSKTIARDGKALQSRLPGFGISGVYS